MSKMACTYNKKGSQGIGTLIIFIALILVAAVAAAVLIQTAASLQSKSLDVGRQSQQKITTDIEVVQVYATNTSDGAINGSIDNITIVVRLGSGSNPVKLSDLVVKFDDPSGSQTVLYNDSGGNSETQFGVGFIINGTNHLEGYLVEGDLASITFTVQNGTTVRESARTLIRMIARNGAVKPIDLTTPPAIVEETLYMYP